MLMLEKFVDRDVVVPVAEMGRFSGLFPRTCRAGYGCHMYFVIYQTGACKWQQCELYGRGKASRVGDVVRIAYPVPGGFAQSVDKMPSCMVPVDSEVIPEVYYPAVGADVMAFQKLPGDSVPEAKEKHIRVVQFRPEFQ